MPRAFFEDGAFFQPGAFFEELVVEAPEIINLGTRAEPAHLLPYKALGGSVSDLDLLYGVIGSEGIRDIRPFFVLGARNGFLRYFGTELPRAALEAAMIEVHTTLMPDGLEDIVIEANPAGDNLFGFVAMTTRPLSSVRLNNSDGYWHAFITRELLLHSPAGLYVDLNQQVALPILVGTIADYDFDGDAIVLTYGFNRPHHKPLIVD